MFRIKICGITRTTDALSAVEAGADAIGMNFYPKSKRYLAPDLAAQIAKSVGNRATKVGVFVNCPIEELSEIVKRVGLDWIQLHGDEPPVSLNEIDANYPILRAYRVGEVGLAPVVEDLAACKVVGRPPNAILIDSAIPGEYGGTGTRGPVFEKKVSDTFFSIPVLLAGGLTPENVAEAIRESRPHGVDVASGVESAPGVKDSSKMKRFVSEALRALGELSS